MTAGRPCFHQQPSPRFPPFEYSSPSLSSQTEAPKPKLPNDSSQTNYYPKRKHPNKRSHAKSIKRRFPSQSSQTEVPKRAKDSKRTPPHENYQGNSGAKEIKRQLGRETSHAGVPERYFPSGKTMRYHAIFLTIPSERSQPKNAK